MKKKTFNILSYILAGLIRLLSWLPLRVLYVLADFLAFLMADVIRYRKKVVLHNLRNAFPEKKENEIRGIARGFYRHLADVVVETIKLLHISDDEVRRRCRLSEETRDLVQSYYDNGQSFIGLLGHYGNWEWVPAVTSINLPFNVVPAYRPLKDQVFDKLMIKLRGRFSHELVPKNNVGRTVVRHLKDENPFIMGLIADQTPNPDHAYWTTFLSQDTPVNAGPEKLARRMNMPVFFVALRRVSRGNYVLHGEKISDTPSETTEGELSERFMALLEREIRQSPAHWLWSHRRWKHRRSEHKDAAKR